jgi:hypothetical protein
MKGSMMHNSLEWIPMKKAIQRFGYYSNNNLNRRLRQLRESGLVLDWGDPPEKYPVSHEATTGKIVLLWASPRAFLIRHDAPKELLNSKRGKRAKMA